MRTRSAELENVSADNKERGASTEDTQIEPVCGESTESSVANLSPMIAVVETCDSFKAYVYVITQEGVPLSSGFAEESRYREVWQLGKDGGLLLERALVECTKAFDRSVDRAWREASGGLDDEQRRALPWKELPALHG